MELDFADWLDKEIAARGWDQTEFAKRAHVTAPQVSRVLSGTRGPGVDFLRGAATALGMPLEDILRKAGILPPFTDLPDEAKDWGERLMKLTEADRRWAVETMDGILRFAEARPQYRPQRKRSAS